FSEIQGGTKSENLSLAIEVLQGKPGPLSDVTALNSGASLYLYGKTKTVREGVDLSKDILRKGLPWSLVEKIRNEYSE
ncbi:MAG: anthranilate phosphoribosyltransferase, partial [Candidatus Eremiobacteraeota bacterium]|nr:anthranilate phosphoribosyltransferase [Candidatus Eremiobacteraeota bacterium]